MQKDIHPEYREVLFHDKSMDYYFIVRSTLKTDETSREAYKVISLNSTTVHFNRIVPLFSQKIQSIEIEEVLVRLAESVERMGEYNFLDFLPNKFNAEKTDKEGEA